MRSDAYPCHPDVSPPDRGPALCCSVRRSLAVYAVMNDLAEPAPQATARPSSSRSATASSIDLPEEHRRAATNGQSYRALPPGPTKQPYYNIIRFVEQNVAGPVRPGAFAPFHILTCSQAAPLQLHELPDRSERRSSSIVQEPASRPPSKRLDTGGRLPPGISLSQDVRLCSDLRSQANSGCSRAHNTMAAFSIILIVRHLLSPCHLHRLKDDAPI